MRKRKTKYEVQNRFSKLGENEKQLKSKIQICFPMSCENEKWIWHLNSLFSRHRKTVGTKVHAFYITSEESRNLFLWIVCVQSCMPLLLRDLTIVISLMYGLPNDCANLQITACAICHCLSHYGYT